jgi:hypothetical protein
VAAWAKGRHKADLGELGLSLSLRTRLGKKQVKLALIVKSAAWQLLDSFSNQLVKLLRLRGERLHLVLSELRLKRHNLLKILCLGDLFDQRER